MSDVVVQTHEKERKRFQIGSKLMTFISLVVGLIIWSLLSMIPSVGAILVSPYAVVKALINKTENGLLTDTFFSLYRVLFGFLLGLIVSIPFAFLMAWFKTFRSLVDPWIQFFRTIPPIAFIPLVIVALGIGESAKVVIIFVATFLVIVISIYQGVKGVNPTLIKAAKVLGAGNKEIFFEVIVPASFPYILVGVRLGLATAWTTLIAAELTGASKGLGDMIMSAGRFFDMDVIIMGIIIIGLVGLLMDKTVLYLERKLAGWQEQIEE